MIEINLLPGARKKSKARSGGDVMASLGSLAASVKDPFLLAAVASVAVAAGGVGLLYVMQTRAVDDLAERERSAVQDSTRYAAVLHERTRAQAQVDSVTRQLSVIRQIDNNRYVWPHVMDEVSRALPPYTWLTEIRQTSGAPAASVPVTGTPVVADSAAKGASPADSVELHALRFQLSGNTVDIQALTRFMRVLEASPFVQNVTLAKSSLVIADGREVTDFRLDAEYQTPDSAAIRTVPVSLSVR